MTENPFAAPEVTDHTVPGGAVTVEISEEWVRRLRSPSFYVVSALTGVSISFAPLGLFLLGLHNQWNVATFLGTAICFLTIYFVPLFYIRLAGHVMSQVDNGKANRGIARL